MVTMKEAMMAMEELMNDMAMTVSALMRSYIHIQSSLLHYYHNHHCYYYSAAHDHDHDHEHGHRHRHSQSHEKKLVMMMKQADRAMVHHLTNLSHLINTSYMQNMSQLHMLLLGLDPSVRNLFSNPKPRNAVNPRNPIDSKVNNPNSSIPNPINFTPTNPSKPSKPNPLSSNPNPSNGQQAETSLYRGHDEVVMHVLRSHPHDDDDDEDMKVGDHDLYANRVHHHHDHHEISNNNSSHLLYNVKNTTKTTTYDDNDNDGDDEAGTLNDLNHQDTPWKQESEEIILKKTRRTKKKEKEKKIGNLHTTLVPQNQGEMSEAEDRRMRSSVHDFRTDQERLIHVPDLSVLPDSLRQTPELLERAVLSASEASRSFTKLMISFMKKSGWDLQIASNAIEPGVKYMQKRHTKFAFESYVNHIMLNGFESLSFDHHHHHHHHIDNHKHSDFSDGHHDKKRIQDHIDNHQHSDFSHGHHDKKRIQDHIDNHRHSDSSDGHHDKKRIQVDCYKEFQDLMPMMMMMMSTSKDMASMDPATIKSGLLLNHQHDQSKLANMLNIDEYISHYDAIISNPKSKFSLYCMHRFLDVIHPKMEEAFFGSLNDHRKQILVHGAHPKTAFYHSFLKLAMAMWMLHKLVFSFPSKDDENTCCAHIFGVERNARFSSLYMESIVQNIVQNLDESMSKSNGSNTNDDHIDHNDNNHKHDECDGTQLPKTVAFTVMPGFRVGGIVIKCQVYVVNLAPDRSRE